MAVFFKDVHKSPLEERGYVAKLPVYISLFLESLITLISKDKDIKKTKTLG